MACPHQLAHWRVCINFVLSQSKTDNNYITQNCLLQMIEVSGKTAQRRVNTGQYEMTKVSFYVQSLSYQRLYYWNMGVFDRIRNNVHLYLQSRNSRHKTVCLKKRTGKE